MVNTNPDLKIGPETWLLLDFARLWRTHGYRGTPVRQMTLDRFERLMMEGGPTECLGSAPEPMRLFGVRIQIVDDDAPPQELPHRKRLGQDGTVERVH